MISAPRLTTQRLLLRPHARSDFAAMCDMWADPAVVRYIGGRPSSRSETWARLLRYGGLWPLLGYGFWAIEARENGRFLGDIGVMEAMREIEPALGAPEVGWALAQHAHGRGLALEALGAVLAWADADASLARTACLIEPDNTASVRIALAAGFVHDRTATMGAATLLVLSRDRPGR